MSSSCEFAALTFSARQSARFQLRFLFFSPLMTLSLCATFCYISAVRWSHVVSILLSLSVATIRFSRSGTRVRGSSVVFSSFNVIRAVRPELSLI
ncbi:hypothetical protein KCP71_10080 [Salmonella enterica subsp. enterica]|nr:hypothetical protein KCP71_10080 [Salmonella enterica subsp. enterica]